VGFRRFNQSQLEKTADLALEVAKTVLLATVGGVLIPGVGEKVGITGTVIGFIVFIAAYLFAMWLLKGVKDKEK
jgi:hypothetical protein